MMDGAKHDGAERSESGGFSLVEFSTRRRVTILMATLTFLLFGFLALSNLKVNLLPDLSYPTLTVRTEYTGAAPSEVETLITEPAEEALGVVKGLRAMTDFEYELQQADLNCHLSPDLESVFVMSSPEYGYVSSSIVREIASMGSSVAMLVPPNVNERLRERFGSGPQG